MYNAQQQVAKAQIVVRALAAQLYRLFKEESTMSQPVELSLEQQFNIRSFETQVQRMSREQAQDFLVKLYEQMMVRENMYKEFIKHQWGLDPIS